MAEINIAKMAIEVVQETLGEEIFNDIMYGGGCIILATEKQMFDMMDIIFETSVLDVEKYKKLVQNDIMVIIYPAKFVSTGDDEVKINIVAKVVDKTTFDEAINEVLQVLPKMR